MTRAVLLVLLAALPVAAQSFAEGPAFGGSAVFSEGGGQTNPARFDRLPEGWYAGLDYGDASPRGAADADRAVLAAESDPPRMPGALQDLGAHPWAERDRRYGFLWAWTGGLHVGYTREDLRGTFAGVDPASPSAVLDARQAVVDRFYAGAGSQAGRTALGFTLRVERVRFGQAAFALQPAQGQQPLADPAAPLDGLPLDRSVTSVTLDAGLTQELGERLRAGLTLDRLAPRRFGDLREDPQARAGLELDLSGSMKLSVESDLNAAARLPIAVKRRVAGASLRVALSPSAFFTLGAERRVYEGAPGATVLGAAFHVRTAPLALALGLRLGDDRPLAAAAFRLPGAS